MTKKESRKKLRTLLEVEKDCIKKEKTFKGADRIYREVFGMLWYAFKVKTIEKKEYEKLTELFTCLVYSKF